MSVEAVQRTMARLKISSWSRARRRDFSLSCGSELRSSSQRSLALKTWDELADIWSILLIAQCSRGNDELSKVSKGLGGCFAKMYLL